MSESEPPPYPGAQSTETKGPPPPDNQPPYPTSAGAGAGQPPPPGAAPYYPPPGQQGYPQGQQQGYPPGQTTVIVQPGMQTVVMGFRNQPVQCKCPNCSQDIVTAMQFETGTMTWLACLGLCLVGCDCGCCFIPFCVDDLKDVHHTCPNCHTLIGVYKRM